MNKQVEVSNLIKPILDVIKFGKDEVSNAFKEGLFNYLHSQTEKFYFTNNFLHRTKKLRFSKIYYPIKATYEDLTTDFSNLKDVFEEYKFVQIIGQAGSGKSTLVNYIFLNSFKSLEKIPILIELRNLNSYDKSLEDYILEKILTLKIKPSETILRRELLSGNFIILLDGYDEITSARKLNIDTEINEFCDKYSKNYTLLTTRPGNGNEFRVRFYSFNVEPLQEEEIPDFIDMQVFDQKRKSELKKVINKASNSDYQHYLSNPLLLSMFILAFESHPEIPKRKSAFYRNVFDTLYSKHDGITKSGFPREKRSGLQREDFENILCFFSFISQVKGKHNYTEEYISDTLIKLRDEHLGFSSNIEDIIFDLRTAVSIFTKDGFEYRFPHRSLQEYFTALFISRLSFDKKEKAYDKLYSAFVNSQDRSRNLLNLCMELDELSFEKYFYLPILKKSLKKIKVKDDKKALTNYFKFFIPILYQTSRNTLIHTWNETPVGRRKRVIVILRDSSSSSFDYYLISTFRRIIKREDCELFFSRSPYSLQLKAYSILRKNESSRKIINSRDTGILNSNLYSHIDYELINESIFELLLEFGFMNIIKGYQADLLNEIKRIENKIQKYLKSIDNLF